MRIHHVALRTDDVGRLERFYVDALGLPVVRRQDGGSVWLDAAGALLMLERRAQGEPPVPAETMELLAFALAPDDLALYTDRLARAGVPIEARTPFTLYFRDPDGRRLALSSYPIPLEAPQHP